jgi:hypothetical protein
MFNEKEDIFQEEIMNIKKVHIELSASEVQQITAIQLDRKAEEALVFLREILYKRVEKALQAH